MRSIVLSLILGAASLGLLAVSPSQAEARLFRRWYPAYSYYYPGYTYSYSYGYPSYSYYWGPGYANYYSYYPGYSTYYYGWPGYRSYYVSPGYYGYWRY